MKIIIILALLPFCYGNPCPKGEYLPVFSDLCKKCTQCKPHQILIRTCQPHKDTLCSSIVKQFTHKNWENYKKEIHHFDKDKLHIISEKDKDAEVIDNNLNYPALELAIKHDNFHIHKNNNKHYSAKKQRTNDKFLKWDDLGDNYETKKHKKHDEHKLSKSNHHIYNKEHHHEDSSEELDDDDEEDDDYDYEDNLDTILDKNSKNSWTSKKWKDDILNAHKIKKNKKAARLAKLEDEKKLEEWLMLSKKQFKDRKDNLLKTLKEEQLDSFERNEKRLRLNYPLFNSNDHHFSSGSMKSTSKTNEKTKTPKKHMESEVELFKELIKNEQSQEMELATLMSNKKEPTYHYKSVTPTHRMFLGAPSDMAEITGHIKDPQEVIKEEMGRNIIYEKSKFSVVPIKNDYNDEIVPVPFSAAERLVWDWQAVAIVSAVAACLLFFLVIGIFFLVNARQWRKEKFIYHPESEEMSTRVALIQPSLEASVADGSNTNKFLQQFLSGNEDKEKSCNAMQKS